MVLRTLHKIAWLAAGGVFLLLTLVGLLLPVVPQLPFFVLSILCFMRGSTRFHAWIHRQRWFLRLKERFPRHRK